MFQYTSIEHRKVSFSLGYREGNCPGNALVSVTYSSSCSCSKASIILVVMAVVAYGFVMRRSPSRAADILSPRCMVPYNQSIRFHPVTPDGKLFLRFRAGTVCSLDDTGRNSRQRSSYSANDSRGECEVATRANGLDAVDGAAKRAEVRALVWEGMVAGA